MNYKARRITSIIFGLMSAVGTVATAILTAKLTPKALEKFEKLKQSKEKPTKWDYIKAATQVYWPAIVTCAGSVSSVTVSNIMSMRTEASLIATSTMLSQGLRKYKNKVTDVLGIREEKAIETKMSADEYSKNKNLKPANEETMFYEEHVGFFSCKKERLLNALTDINQRLHTPDSSPKGTFYWTSLYFLLKDSGAKVYNNDSFKIAKNFGWTTEYLSEADELECIWVHPVLTNVIKKSTGEVLYVALSFFEEPICLTEVDKLKYRHLDALLSGYSNDKTTEDYKHEAEIDLAEQEEPFDYDAYMFATHGGADTEDNGNRFYESDRSLASGGNAFIEDNDDYPCESDIPELGGN